MKLEPIIDLIHKHYRPQEYPTLHAQIELWRQTRPLAGYRLLDATPLYRNTLVKHLALLAAGADLSIGLSDTIQHDPTVAELIRTAGLPLLHAASSRPHTFDLILDCAGAFCRWPAAIGYVELTRSGVAQYTDSQRPVYVADSGRIKHIETLLGTGESYFRAMAQLGYHDWEKRSVVIFGSGKVGSGLILYAHRAGAHITAITDPATLTPSIHSYVNDVIDYRNHAAIGQAVRTAYAVITATGHPAIFQQGCPSDDWQASAALMANMGVEDEYGPEIPPERVLNRKETLNFILEEPTHLKYIDATMALHNEGALYLLQHHDVQGFINPDPETEERLLHLSCTQGVAGEEIALLLSPASREF